MSMEQELLDLEDDLGMTYYYLEIAQENASQLYRRTMDYRKDEHGCPRPVEGTGWLDMELLARRLEVLMGVFQIIAPDSVKQAIESAEEELNRQEDLADAQSS